MASGVFSSDRDFVLVNEYQILPGNPFFFPQKEKRRKNVII